MKLLLLGAGFSRNWGGWLAIEVFEWLLGHSAIVANAEARTLLWTCQKSGGGFEEALAIAQTLHATSPGTHGATLKALQVAIEEMFEAMNSAMHLQKFEFSQEKQWQVATFLSRFDAIFTLNQDTLLEHFYCNENVHLNAPQKWTDVILPGMKKGLVTDTAYKDSWAYSDWVPSPEGKFLVPDGYQPIYKLHGSSNWRNSEGGSLLIMGGAKSKAIASTPLLQAYMDKFRKLMSEKGAKLMTIGYGFRDEHINEAISLGAKADLRLFNISPQGAEAATASNPQKQGNVQGPNSELEDAFESRLIGASRRPLSALFGHDVVELRKVLRFLE